MPTFTARKISHETSRIGVIFMTINSSTKTSLTTGKSIHGGHEIEEASYEAIYVCDFVGISYDYGRSPCLKKF